MVLLVCVDKDDKKCVELELEFFLLFSFYRKNWNFFEV